MKSKSNIPGSKAASMGVDPSSTASRATSSHSQPHVPIGAPKPQAQVRKPHGHGHGHGHEEASSHSHPFVYPVSSSGRGFIPKGVRPISSADHILTATATATAYHRLPYSLRPNHSNFHYPHLPAPSPPNPINPLPLPLPLSLSPHPIKAAPRPAVSDSNGYKDRSTRERSRDDTCHVIRDRKVRITEDASVYALCRSWLRNGVNEENQPQQKDVMKALPKPLPASMVASYMSNKKEDEKDEDEQEQNEESVENLSPQDLLKRHVKRAKKVRARLREERLQRITRYRSRLRLLLPPPVEQFRNDTAAGN